MIDLTKYADIFGKPETGVHKFRLFNIALIDLFLTIVFCYGIAYYFNYSFYKLFIILMVLSVFFHYIFGVKTGLLKMLKLV